MRSGDDAQKHTLTSVEEKKQDQLNNSTDKLTDAAHNATCMLYQHKHSHTPPHPTTALLTSETTVL